MSFLLNASIYKKYFYVYEMPGIEQERQENSFFIATIVRLRRNNLIIQPFNNPTIE
ncbi:MAG: hypothetical protein WBB36_04715 [Chitinophagales bacterium]